MSLAFCEGLVLRVDLHEACVAGAGVGFFGALGGKVVVAHSRVLSYSST